MTDNQKEILFYVICIIVVLVFVSVGCITEFWDNKDAEFRNSVRYVEKDDYGRPRYYTYKNIDQTCAEYYGYSRPGRTVASVENIVHPGWVRYLTIFYDDKSVVSFYYDWDYVRPDDYEIIFDKWEGKRGPLYDNKRIGYMKRPPVENKNAFIKCLEQNEPLQPKVEVINAINDAINEKNQKIDETKQLLENKKTKLTVKAEIEDGSTIKETEIEFTLDSLGDNDIDLANHAILNILTKED
jgi:hypothetical protein